MPPTMPPLWRLICCAILAVCTVLVHHAEAQFSVGIGKADITGPVADVNLMGYAQPKQKAAGLHTRLYARTYIVCSSANPRQCIVFVNIDANMPSQLVTMRVLSKLQATYGDLYTSTNVVISATHTHASPAGYLQYVLYSITSFGFVEQSFNAIVDGIMQSIKMAHGSIQPTRMFAASGELLDANINRSPTAYLANPLEERARYRWDIDKDMTLVKLLDANGRGRGAITWFPVHCTSLNNTNRLISGDNKGAAEQFMEAWARNQQQIRPDFVAAFAQANVGDTSPNVQGAFCIDTGLPCEPVTSTCNGKNELCHGRGPNWPDDTRSTETIGLRQAQKAMSLWTEAQEEIVGPVDSRHVFLDMSNLAVSASKYTRPGRTCKPAMGYAFAAGTTDGPGAMDFKQSATTGIPMWDMVRNMIAEPTPEQVACHAPKPILLDTGNLKFPYDWQPSIVEISLLRAGQLVILGVPGEMSTMAGRRMRAAVQDFVRSAWGDNLRIVIAGLTNTYSGYVTTFEEYQVQRYEGASTIFGPNTLDAYIQEMLKLADAMIKGVPVTSAVKPPDLSSQQVSFLTPVLYDDKPFWKSWGEVLQAPQSSYNSGDKAVVKFRSACPRNNLRTGGTFLTVERMDPQRGSWQVVHTDNDWCTKFLWERPFELSPESYATIVWTIPADVNPGQFRICHFGDWKSGWTGAISPFSACSGTFTVRQSMNMFI